MDVVMGGNHTYTHGGWISLELVRRRKDPLIGTESWRSATSGSKVVGAETRGRRECNPAVVMRGCVEVVGINVEGDRRTSKTRAGSGNTEQCRAPCCVLYRDVSVRVN